LRSSYSIDSTTARVMFIACRDPTDPNKFFQDNSRQQFFDDAVKFATLLVSAPDPPALLVPLLVGHSI
jgi:hypothetical protein